MRLTSIRPKRSGHIERKEANRPKPVGHFERIGVNQPNRLAILRE